MTDHLPFVTKSAAGITFVTGTNLILSSGTLNVVNSPDFPGNLVVGQSASIKQDILYSGSINLIAGSGISFDGKTISNTGASSTIAGVAQINSQTGTIYINAGPGVSVNTAGGTIQVVNIGTVAPGANVVLNSGTLAVPLFAGAGLDFASGTFTNIGTLAPGLNVLISGGSIGVPIFSGPGISFANATIVNTGVLSVQGFTGNVSLVGGTGIDIVSNTVINTGVTAINGQTGSLVAVSTLTSGAGISVSYASGTTIVANTGVLSFNNATGNVTGVNSVNGVTDDVVLQAQPGISIGSPSGGTIPIANTGTLAPGQNVQINSGSVGVPLYAGNGISFADSTISNTAPLYGVGAGLSLSNGTLINTGQSTPLSAGDGISISDSTITNTAPLYAVGAGLSLSSGTVLNTGTLAPGQNVQIGSGSVGVTDTPQFSELTVSSGSIIAFGYGSSGSQYTQLSNLILASTAPAGDFALWPGFTFRMYSGGSILGGLQTVNDGAQFESIGGTNILTWTGAMEQFYNASSTVNIRLYSGTRYVVYPPLTANAGVNIPSQYLVNLTSGGGTLAVTGQSSSGTVSAYEVLSPSNTLSLAVTAAIVGTVSSATIQIINPSSTDTPQPYQQKIELSNANFAGTVGIATLGQNIWFSDQSGATLLPSWMELYVPSGTTIWWVLLDSIPASSTVQILANQFTNGQSVLNATVTGVAANQGTLYGLTYGQYDTGSVVFPRLYTNYAGTVLPSIFSSTIDGGKITVSDGLQMSAGVGEFAEYWVTGTVVGTVMAFESLANDYGYGGFSMRDAIGILGTKPPTTADAFVPPSYSATVNPFISFNEAQLILINSSGTNVNVSGAPTATLPATSGPSVYNVIDSQRVVGTLFYWFPTGTVYNSLFAPVSTVTPPLGTVITPIEAAPNLTQVGYGLSVPSSFGSGESQWNVSWTRIRNEPSGGMPVIQTTSIEAIPTIVFPQDANFINLPTSSSIAEWSNILGKAYVTVSPYGTVNVSTITIANNGADYGPDTPNTTSLGANEAIAYVFNNGGGKVRFLGGKFNLGTLITSADGSAFTAIEIPANNNSYPIGIELEGAGPVEPWGYGAGSFGSPQNETVFIAGFDSGTLQTNVIYVNKGPLNYGSNPIDFKVKNIHVQIPTGQAINGINGYYAKQTQYDNVLADVNESDYANIPQPTSPNNPSGGNLYDNFVGLIGALDYSFGMNTFRNSWVMGFYGGISLTSHVTLDSLGIQACEYAIISHGAYHANYSINTNIQNCPYTIYTVADSPTGATNFAINGYFDFERNVSGGDLSPLPSWASYITDCYPNANHCAGRIIWHETRTATKFGPGIPLNGSYPGIRAIKDDSAGFVYASDTSTQTTTSTTPVILGSASTLSYTTRFANQVLMRANVLGNNNNVGDSVTVGLYYSGILLTSDTYTQEGLAGNYHNFSLEAYVPAGSIAVGVSTGYTLEVNVSGGTGSFIINNFTVKEYD